MSQLNYEELIKKYDCKHLSLDLVEKMIKDRKIRIAVCRESFYIFFHFYFAHYVKYETAPFQREIFHLAEQKGSKNLFVIAFRGSGKSTILTTAYPIWAILGEQQKKFVLILCQTRSQAKQHMMNLKRELESNQLLKNDLGPFQEETDEWGSSSLVFSRLNVRVTAASTEQSIRGLRHNQHRPDLIVGDDVEDLASSKTREGRQKVSQWLTGEVIPAGDKNTRLVIVGNLLHEDSLLVRLKNDIGEGLIEGTYREYPLLDEKEVCAWPGKYPATADIEAEKKKLGNEIAWQREYLLRIIPSDEQLVHPSWIQYYDKLPPKTHKAYRCTYVSVDLAISKKEAADYTAIVSAMVFGRADRLRIYILPNPIIKKITFPEQVDLLKIYSKTAMDESRDILLVEGVGYQDALPQMLETLGIKATAVKPSTDKRTRLALIAPLIRSGKVKFPRVGAEEIIRQITGFGVEKHDDAADALSMLVSKISEIHFHEGTWIMFTLGPGSFEDNAVFYDNYVDIGDEF